MERARWRDKGARRGKGTAGGELGEEKVKQKEG